MSLFDIFKPKNTNRKLPILEERLVDEEGDIWNAKYKYDDIEILFVNCQLRDFVINENIELKINAQTVDINDMPSIIVSLNNTTIGYIKSIGQRRMILDFTREEGHMVKAQISCLHGKNVLLRIYYYISESYLAKKEAEQKAIYEAEKAAYQRKETLFFDATLIGNGSEQLQWDIQQANAGDKIEIEIDENDRYFVCTQNALDLGYLPKRISDKIDDLTNADNCDYQVCGEISEITNIDDKFVVKVHLKLEDKAYL